VKITYISKYAVLPEFGAPTRQYFLSKYMAASGHEVKLIGSRSIPEKVPPFKGLYRSVKEGNLEMVTLQGPPVKLGFSLKRVWSWLVFEINLFRYYRHLKKFKPDVVIVSSLSILTFIFGVYVKKKLKIPLVLEIRDIYPLTLVEVGNYSPRHPLVKFIGWVEKYGYKHADLILSTLPNCDQHIEKVMGKKVNFKWIPMGIDPDYFGINPSDPAPAFQPEPGVFKIGYAGTIGLANAMDVIFEAAADLEKDYPDIRFIITGDGPMKPDYIKKYGHLKNIEFRDPVSKKGLQPLLTTMNLLIHSYLNQPIYRYGVSPNKWIDYMLSARPVLVALGGQTCIVGDAGCGIFVRPEDKEALKKGILEFYKKSPEELDEMGRKGREYLLSNLTYPYLAGVLSEQLEKVVKQYYQ